MDNNELLERVQALEKRMIAVEGLAKPLTPLSSVSDREALEKAIVDYVEQTQRELFKPVKFAQLARVFGKRCIRFGGVGIQDFMETLSPRVRVVLELTGNRIVYAGSYYDSLPADEREYLKFPEKERRERLEMHREIMGMRSELSTMYPESAAVEARVLQEMNGSKQHDENISVEEFDVIEARKKADEEFAR